MIYYLEWLLEVQQNKILITLSILFIITVFSILYYFKTITKHILESIRIIKCISNGNYNKKLYLEKSLIFPELKELSSSINHMSEDMKNYVSTIDNQYIEMTELIANAVEINDSYTYHHNNAVARYSKIIGEAINFNNMTELNIAARLHDMGKISIPTQILNKPGKLTNSEYEIIKRHPVEGDKLVCNIKYFNKIRLGIRHHHERYDGTGYPDKLKGDDIPLIAQIISLADVFDALTSDRAYRIAMTYKDAMEIILDGSGTMFNPFLVNAFYLEMNKYLSASSSNKVVNS